MNVCELGATAKKKENSTGKKSRIVVSIVEFRKKRVVMSRSKLSLYQRSVGPGQTRTTKGRLKRCAIRCATDDLQQLVRWNYSFAVAHSLAAIVSRGRQPSLPVSRPFCAL